MSQATPHSAFRTPHSILALDIGTSSTRALLFDLHGDKIGDAAQKPYDQTTTPDGGVETDADALLELTCACIDELSARAQGEILAVAASCFWHSLLAVDESGNALSPLYSWADNRAAPWIAPLCATLDKDAAHARTGCVFHTSYWPAKLLWLHHTRPELFGPDTRWMSFGEYLELKLFGAARVSLSMASGTGIFHQAKCDWDDETLAALPIERENLSPLCEFVPHSGVLLDVFKARWPRLIESKWFPALGDGACSNVGSGGTDATKLVLNVGTSGAVRVVLENYDAPAPRGLWRYRLDRRRSVMGGALSNGGSVFAWVKANFNLPENVEELISGMPSDSHGLVVLPFLAGERSPLWNADARFVLAGASLDTTAADILRACLESVSLRFAAVAALVRRAVEENGDAAPQEIIASGGALGKSACWKQIMADALGTDLGESQESEASARGAALMALEACEIISDIADLPAQVGEKVRPNAASVSVFQRARERQNHLIEKLLGDPLTAH